MSRGSTLSRTAEKARDKFTAKKTSPKRVKNKAVRRRLKGWNK